MSTPQQGRKEVCVFSVSQNEEAHCFIFLPPVGDARLHLVCVAVCVRVAGSNRFTATKEGDEITVTQVMLPHHTHTAVY